MKQDETKLNEAGSLTTLLTVAETALRLKVAKGTVYNWVHSGKLVPAGWLRGVYPRFRVADVDAMVESNTRERAPRKRNASHGA